MNLRIMSHTGAACRCSLLYANIQKHSRALVFPFGWRWSSLGRVGSRLQGLRRAFEIQWGKFRQQRLGRLRGGMRTLRLRRTLCRPLLSCDKEIGGADLQKIAVLKLHGIGWQLMVAKP